MASHTTISGLIGMLKLLNIHGGPTSKDEVDAVVRIWTLCLSDVPDEQLEYAVASVMNDPTSCQFWPQPGVVRAHMEGAVPVGDRAMDCMAYHVWGLLMCALSEPGGSEHRLAFEPKVLNAYQVGVAACGGLDSIRESNRQELAAHRTAFRNAFKATLGLQSGYALVVLK